MVLLPYEAGILGRESDHLPPPSAKVKNACIYTVTLSYVFPAWLIKQTALLVTPQNRKRTHNSKMKQNL